MQPKSKPKHRHAARRYALQALYQWHMSANSLDDIQEQFSTEKHLSKMDQEYFNQLLFGVPTQLETLEKHISAVIDRPLEDLNPIERVILWLGTYELLNCLEVPYRVVINESVTLAKTFGASDGYKYVNGVLDKMAKDARKIEITSFTGQA